MTDIDTAAGTASTEIDNGVTSKGRRFDSRDWKTIAEFIRDESERRKQDADRRHLEKVWKEIDRQLRMEPDPRMKKNAVNGQAIPGTEWMAEMEVPNQSQTLEVLTSDARKLIFPDAGLWFEAHSLVTDQYLQSIDFKGIIAGDETEVPSQIKQNDVDKLVEGYLEHYHNQYDFRGTIDQLNAEAFKYGTLVARGRIVTRSVFIETQQGTVERDQKIPMLVPQSIRYTLLDKSPQALMNEGMMVGPSPIRFYTQKLVDLQLAAVKGGTDPDDMDGGWMPSNTKLDPDDRSNVELLEYEGDLVVPRKTTRSIFLPNCIVTVAIGKNQAKVVRFRFNKLNLGSYIIQLYHTEGSDNVYGVSPLMKGMPIQKALSDSLNRLVDWGLLNTQPPLSYMRDDPFFAATGGPIVAPRELWASANGVKAEKIGDGNGLLAVYQEFRRQYDDVTGVNAPRLGAQTVSHTTAFAKNVEIQKGQARTVDYVDSFLTGGLTRWLNMEFELGKMAMKGEETFFIADYGGWVEIGKQQLPDQVIFEAYGAGEPAEQQARLQKKTIGLQMAMQIDGLKKQYGIGQPLNYQNIQREILTEAGWTDVELFFANPTSSVPPGAAPAPAVPGPGIGLGQTADTALEGLVG